MSRAVEETNRRMLRDAAAAGGVEITEEPYGIDCALRDPFGNHLRFHQPKA